ncbi:G-protein coupled receptor 143-like [Corythoichthys intestinalis]|uniref:G-protein coupled receptor 143-like n=1 Tax=Corythoichthys intestinalis TaxID=161448 RepID=UPI0025A51ACD|nr:G-protein coupled receptor 143-like [Corythoichthys intestinalis]XP_061799123.1 G-protein coupled receptor 143-like [Nerophis lumbriciformis]
MASPRLETFCCSNRDAATELVVTFQPLLFGVLTAVSAGVSALFALLQILPKRKGYRRLGQYPLPRPASSSRILFIISVCDILGCAGILLRSSLWVGLPNAVEQISVANSTDAWPDVLCLGSAMWIQLFYSASFWWTFCYAVDVFLVVKTSAGISTIILYHMITWGLALLLCVEGVAMLYYPSISNCEQGFQHAIPHYVTTYAPMLLVLVANPIFFNRTTSAVTSLLKGRQGIYTENERRLANAIKIRFFKIMLVFCICWIPNILNEGLLFYLEMQVNIGDSGLRNIRNAALITWFIMGILNPMQAFLNTLAFHGWTGFDVDLSLRGRRDPVWESASTSAANGGGRDSMLGTALLYQSHVQEAKKNMNGNGQLQSDAISVLSEGSESSTVEIHISSELPDYGDIDADEESLGTSGKH